MLKPLLFATAGGVAGFFIAKLRYEKAAYAYANQRIEEAKVYAEERADRKIQKFLAEAEVVEAGTATTEKNEDEKEETFEVSESLESLLLDYQGFSSPLPPMDIPEEEDSESHIVLIRRKEFFEGPLNDDYDQVAVTYYQNDDILIDETDKQLDVRAAIGNIRPSWFGHEAEDENVCYVRNTKVEIEFEVIRSQGSYAKDVLGIGD